MHCINLYTAKFNTLLHSLKEALECPLELTIMQDPVTLVPCMHKVNHSSLVKIVAGQLSGAPCPLCYRHIVRFFGDSILKGVGSKIRLLQACVKNKAPFSTVHTTLLETLSFVECSFSGKYPQWRYLTETLTIPQSTDYRRIHAKALEQEINGTRGYKDFSINEVTKTLLEMYEVITRNAVTLLNKNDQCSLYFCNIVTFLKPKEIGSFASVCMLWNRMQQSDAFWHVSQSKILPHPIRAPQSSFTFVGGVYGRHPLFFHRSRDFFFTNEKEDGLFKDIYFCIHVDRNPAAYFYYSPANREKVTKYLHDAGLDPWVGRGISLAVDEGVSVNFDLAPFHVFNTLFQDHQIPARYLTILYHEVLNRKRFITLRKLYF